MKQASPHLRKFIFVMKILPFGLLPVRLKHLPATQLYKELFLKRFACAAVGAGRAGMLKWSGGAAGSSLYCAAIELPLFGSCL